MGGEKAANNAAAKNRQVEGKRKTPRAYALRGYSLTCSNPATKVLHASNP